VRVIRLLAIVDLEAAIAVGIFRLADLVVFRSQKRFFLFEIPPLRERREESTWLVEYFTIICTKKKKKKEAGERAF